MARANEQVAALLSEYAELLTMTGGDRFKIRSYEKAARALRGHHADLATLDGRGVQEIPGVGKSIAGKVVEARDGGTFRQLEELRAEVPDGVRTLMAIPNLGPSKALAVHRELGISSVEELEAAIDAGRLRDLKGFGARSEEVIKTGIGLLRSGGGRVLMPIALGLAESMVARLAPLADRCAYAGSLRRGRETVGDIDVLATAAESGPLMDAFAALPEVASVLLRGDTKTSVRTGPLRGAPGGLQVDLRVVPVECWGAALQYFTGSKEHNVRVRELAVHAKLKLSEYGLFDAESGELIVADTEESVYQRLGLAWVPPTLREDTGEVAAARAGTLPRLVTVDDLRGDLHTHTDLTDGVSSLTEMLDAAAARGYAYYAVTDHAPDLVMQRMTLEKALAQRAQLRALQDRYPDMRLLHGSELNIGPDGTVDWPAEVLSGFDVCVASVHSHFTLPVAEQTRRLIRACENPHVHVIGHLTGRRLGRRPPIEVDLDAVFAAAARTGTAIEVNGGPERLDLRDEHIRWARRHGVKFAVDSDAHAVPELNYVRYATLTGQRGWLEPDDVINTWPYERFRAFLDGR
jgi:DNA polymerase (family 10)